ncbi:MAG: hypothetical protein J6W19_11275 [Prevotella sp.]|nr:hypothetical protein [Prevotella sp.]
MRLHTLRLLLAAGILLAATASCYNYDQEDVINLAENHFINVTISVSTSDAPATRAPQGGEYGDGTERGIDDRENKINNITLIFYQDNTDINQNNTDINTTSENAKVVCVERYSVRPFDEASDKPTTHNHKDTEPTSNHYPKEVLYTTGNQKLENTPLVIGQSYKVLVVANAEDLYVTVGDKIKDVREQVLSSVFTGTGIGIDASNFVMASETDATVTLEDPTKETVDGENRMIYYFDCIHIERLAARIDYNTTGGQYAENIVMGPNGEPANDPAAINRSYRGYKYRGSGNEFFVVTKVTAFNLYDESEFCFKRIRNNWTDATPTITYLGDESTTNYVVDPNTENKVNVPTTLNYLNPIANLNQQPGPAGGSLVNNTYTQVMADVYNTSLFTDNQGNKNVIIGYAKENTLRPGSLLKTYATGIAFEIKYYNSENDPHPKYFVYYHYLRHQGEKEAGSYQAKKLEDIATDNEIYNPSESSPAMNYGIVRNNIYRVSIEGMTPDKVTLLIKVKKWDKFVHEPIYM